jgi:hypothetical protein
METRMIIARVGFVRVVLWGALVGAAFPAAAHDFWIEPSTFRPHGSQTLSVGLRVGDHFEGQRVPRTPDRIVTFVAVGPEGERSIPGRAGIDPAGFVRFTTPGTHVLGFRSNNAFTEMEPDRFKRHLQEKGLDAILARLGGPTGVAGLAGPGRTGRKVREAYSRCSKSLIRVGDAAGQGGDRSLGFTLEIVSESDPYDSAAGAEMAFRIVHEGRPLEGALVTAARRGASGEPLSARTDADGRVSFRLGEAGMWLIACVHMAEAPKDVDAAWESLWASLTFELPAASAVAARDKGL